MKRVVRLLLIKFFCASASPQTNTAAVGTVAFVNVNVVLLMSVSVIPSERYSFQPKHQGGLIHALQSPP